MREILIVLLVLVTGLSADSFADWMTKDFCDRQLSVGQVIMNNNVVLSDERSLRVFRGEDELVSGSVYHHSESLTISISNSHNQYVYEALGGATFDKGGCDGKRIANKPQAILHMPTSGDSKINIVAGWATGHEAVNVSPGFILVPEEWNDRRADLIPSAEAEDTHENKENILHAAAEHNEHKETEHHGEVDPRLAASDYVGRAAGDMKHENVQTVIHHTHEKIPEPQQDLYAHELHKDEHHTEHVLHNEDGKSQHVDGHDHHLLPDELIEQREGHIQVRDDSAEHHRLSIRDDPEEHLPHKEHNENDHDLHLEDGEHFVDRVRKAHRDQHLAQVEAMIGKKKEHRDALESHGVIPKGLGVNLEHIRDDDIKHAEQRRAALHPLEDEHDTHDNENAHPHSLNEKDHDLFDIEKRKEMDKVRDRELFQGKNEQVAVVHDKDEGRDVEIEKQLEEELGLHKSKNRVKRNGKPLGKNTGKRALRGGSSYSEYVKSHTVLLGEMLLGGCVVVFLLYRLFASRFKIHRYFRKIKGMEEK